MTGGSPCGSRSPGGNPFLPSGVSNNSNGSYWNLQRKPSFDQPHLVPGVGGGGGVLGSFGTSPPQMEGPIVFIAPELTQETLMEVLYSMYNLIQIQIHPNYEINRLVTTATIEMRMMDVIVVAERA